MQAIIRRFDRAPLEDKLLRANPAQPSKGKSSPITQATPGRDQRTSGRAGGNGSSGGGSGKPKRRERDHEPKSAFATELANSLAK